MTTAEIALKIFCSRQEARGVMDIGTAWSLENLQIAWDLAKEHKRIEREFIAAMGEEDE
jgi:hypothetical protein